MHLYWFKQNAVVKLSLTSLTSKSLWVKAFSWIKREHMNELEMHFFLASAPRLLSLNAFPFFFLLTTNSLSGEPEMEIFACGCVSRVSSGSSQPPASLWVLILLHSSFWMLTDHSYAALCKLFEIRTYSKRLAMYRKICKKRSAFISTTRTQIVRVRCVRLLMHF